MSTSMIDIAQLLFSDSPANGAVTAFGSITAGSGYVNGTYTDVPLTGGSGRLARADITVSGGAVTGVVLHTPARGGFNYHTADSLSASNANLGGSGSGFAVAVSTVSSGAASGPQILMTADTAGADFVGFGQDSATPGDNAIRFGGTGNTGSAWDNVNNPTAKPYLSFSGGVLFGTLSGVFTGQAQIQAMTGGVSVTQAGSTTPAAISASFIRLAPTTVAGLATVDASPSDGDEAYVTDATSPTFNGALTGGGSVHTRVHYDGSATVWKAG